MTIEEFIAVVEEKLPPAPEAELEAFEARIGQRLLDDYRYLVQSCIVVAYLAAAPKSNAATLAIGRVMEELTAHGVKPVPRHLRDSHYPGGKTMGHGKGYLYPHDFPNHYVAQQYLPDGVQGTPFYEPTEQGAEARIKKRMEDRKVPPYTETIP